MTSPAIEKKHAGARTDARVEAIRAEMGEEWLPVIYRDRILPLRTRAHHLDLKPGKQAIEVQQTLLGVELKIGRRRMACPDYATARYLSVFARAGCPDVAVPYDITKISHLADALESSWQRMLLLVERDARERGPQSLARLRGLLLAEVREEIGALGAGTAIPRFNQNTRQRRSRKDSTTG